MEPRFLGAGRTFFCTAPAPTLETQTKGPKLEQKVRNSKKRYEIRREGRKFKGKYAKQQNEMIFSVSRNNSKHFFRIFVFFQFRETMETWRNSDLFCTVWYFAKQDKNTKLSTLVVEEKISPFSKARHFKLVQRHNTQNWCTSYDELRIRILSCEYMLYEK